ncbi:MAG: 4a-hydroxytetrahydrobiopterin dehydratase [Candidatus Nanohaloarchaea archaeon]
MSDTLDEDEIDERLEELQIWGLEFGNLVTRVEFDGYRDAVFFANMVFSLAEEEFHHPTVRVEYGAVEIDLYSHEEDGITEKDLEMARKIEDKVGDVEWS